MVSGHRVKDVFLEESIIESRKRKFNVMLMNGHLELRNHWEGRNKDCSIGGG
jgi:hypothetical protein